MISNMEKPRSSANPCPFCASGDQRFEAEFLYLQSIYNTPTRLYKKFLTEYYNKINVFYEVGVCFYKECRTRPQIEDPNKIVHLFEPHPKCAEDLRFYTQLNKNTFVHEVAISDSEGEELFTIDDTASSYVWGVKEENERTLSHSHTITVKTAKISYFDEGNVDVLLVDAEGCEHFLLEHLISRPLLITVELGKTGYTKSNHIFILEWMKKNDYYPTWHSAQYLAEFKDKTLQELTEAIDAFECTFVRKDIPTAKLFL